MLTGANFFFSVHSGFLLIRKREPSRERAQAAEAGCSSRAFWDEGAATHCLTSRVRAGGSLALGVLPWVGGSFGPRASDLAGPRGARGTLRPVS